MLTKRDNEILHILRNPYGKTSEEIKEAQIDACKRIEDYHDAYENMKEFAKENGLDTVAYNR